MRNLMCVKSIVTICLTLALVAAVFIYPDVYEETFKNAVTMVVTFYFAHQFDKWQSQNMVVNKKEDDSDGKRDEADNERG